MAFSGRQAVCFLASRDEHSVLPTKPADSDTREGDCQGTELCSVHTLGISTALLPLLLPTKTSCPTAQDVCRGKQRHMPFVFLYQLLSRFSLASLDLFHQQLVGQKFFFTFKRIPPSIAFRASSIVYVL